MPEPSQAPHSLVNVAAAIEAWLPGAPAEEQARLASRIFTAVSAASSPALPASSALTLEELKPEQEAAPTNGHQSFPAATA